MKADWQTIDREVRDGSIRAASLPSLQRYRTELESLVNSGDVPFQRKIDTLLRRICDEITSKETQEREDRAQELERQRREEGAALARRAIAVSEEAVQVSKGANVIGAKANDISRRANRISVIAVVLAGLAMLVSLLQFILDTHAKPPPVSPSASPTNTTPRSAWRRPAPASGTPTHQQPARS